MKEDTAMASDAPTIADEIRELLAAELCCRPEAIAVDDDLTALPGLDSLKLLKVVSVLERRYDIGLDDGLLYDLRTVADLAELVHVELRETMHLVSDDHGRPA
jgi:acyl carrier protein